MILTYTISELCKTFLHIPEAQPWKFKVVDLSNLDEEDCSKFAIKLFAKDIEETIFTTDQLIHQKIENWDDKMHKLCVCIVLATADALASALHNGQGILDLDKIIDMCQEDWEDQLFNDQYGGLSYE